MKENQKIGDLSERASERAKRIEEKSERIAKKGKRIAQKNNTEITFPAHEEKSSDNKTDDAELGTAVEKNEDTVAATEKKPIEKKKGNGGIVVASILSSVSLLLLVCIAMGAILGIFSDHDFKSVYISVSGGGPIQYEDYEGSPDMLEDVKHSVVVINTQSSAGYGVGSGIIITEDGYIVTNYHVVEDANTISVRLYDSAISADAELIGYSEPDDIAVLKIKRTDLRAATFALSSDCRVGDRVYAIGSPEGDEFSWSVTQGIISSRDREIKIYDNEGILEKKMYVLQTDASVNPGNSGGPLINVRGEVVGIITLKLSDSAGMGFAIPSDGALEIINAIIETGSADNIQSSVSSGRPLMGITGGGVVGGTWYEYIEGVSTPNIVTEEYAKEHSDTCIYAEITGVRVSAITKGLDAENKLKVGDIITEVEGFTVTNIYQVMDIINQLDGGDTITVKYYRNGKYNTVSITLGTAKN